jgi:hypothetical protein
MRDALSILDQLLSLSPKKLSADLLDEVLPPAQDELIFRLLGHAADGDAAAVLADTDAALSQGRSLETFCNDMIEVVRALMLARTIGADTDLTDIPAAARDEYTQLAGRFELSHYVQMIAMLEELRRNVHFSGAGRALTDALMVRLAKMTQWASIEQLLAQTADGESATTSAGRPASSVGGGRSASGPARSTSTGGSADEKKNAPAPLRPATAAAERPASPPLARPAPPVDVPAASSRRPTPALDLDDSPSYDPGSLDTDFDEPTCGEPTYEGAPPAGHDRSPADTSRAAATVDLAPRRAPSEISAADAARIKRDPVVRQVLELFDGAVCNIEMNAPNSRAVVDLSDREMPNAEDESVLSGDDEEMG